MPPKVKVVKEDILNTAFLIIQRDGISNLNARCIAKELNCSTQPIFSQYSNMSELKQELYGYAKRYYDQYIERHIEGIEDFIGIGMAYISFAINEKNLFALLYLSNNYIENDIRTIFQDDDNIELTRSIAQGAGITFEQARDLYMNIWTYAHGLAVLVSLGNMHLNEDEIRENLARAFRAFLINIKGEY